MISEFFLLIIQSMSLQFNSIKNCELYIPGYEITLRDRNRNGGGVCFYIKTSINFVRRRDLNLNDLENLCLEIQKPCSKPFLVVTWYRPPSGAPNGNFRENICSEGDLRSRIFGAFVVTFLACLPLLGFSNIYKMV